MPTFEASSGHRELLGLSAAGTAALLGLAAWSAVRGSSGVACLGPLAVVGVVFTVQIARSPVPAFTIDGHEAVWAGRRLRIVDVGPMSRRAAEPVDVDVFDVTLAADDGSEPFRVEFTSALWGAHHAGMYRALAHCRQRPA